MGADRLFGTVGAELLHDDPYDVWDRWWDDRWRNKRWRNNRWRRNTSYFNGPFASIAYSNTFR
jgi:hypothetical protein